LLLSLLSLAFCRIEIGNLHLPHVPDEYIITYHENTTHEEAASHWALMETAGISFIHKYAFSFHTGFAAKITDKKVLDALQEDPLVFAIEANGFAYAYQTCGHKQTNTPSWGLARVSHEGSVASGIKEDYVYSASHDGKGVDVYVIDTGILVTHEDFGPATQRRARWGVAYADGGSQTDGNGHGTHCAGTIAGALHGVAKAANVVAVKVLGASGGGTWADVIAGVDYCGNNGVAGKALCSMSLGGSGSNAGLTNAVNACVGKGIPVVVASGNSNADACNYTPAGITSTICVNSMEVAGAFPNEYDMRSSFSNYGRCTDMFAPGRDITSAWIGSNTATNTISGTSMACPHVAGMVAGILSHDSSKKPDAVLAELLRTSQPDLVQNAGANTPNVLLHNECKAN
jgi:subtilisin family serine protease